MLFDHDPEIGAILLLNLDRDNGKDKPKGKIEGFLYRKDEIKETQEAERDGKLVKEEITVQTDWYVMDCQGNWYNIKESTNPFIFYMPYFVDSDMAKDKAQLAYPILKDWILNLYHGEVAGTVAYIPHEEPKDIAEDDEEGRKAYYAKFKINMDLLFKSAEWIEQAMTPETDEEKKLAQSDDPKKQFDGQKKLLRKLDEFEYDIGDKK